MYWIVNLRRACVELHEFYHKFLPNPLVSMFLHLSVCCLNGVNCKEDAIVKQQKQQQRWKKTSNSMSCECGKRMFMVLNQFMHLWFVTHSFSFVFISKFEWQSDWIGTQSKFYHNNNNKYPFTKLMLWNGLINLIKTLSFRFIHLYFFSSVVVVVVIPTTFVSNKFSWLNK